MTDRDPILLAVKAHALRLRGRHAEANSAVAAEIVTEEAAEIEARKDRLRRAMRGDYSGFPRQD